MRPLFEFAAVAAVSALLSSPAIAQTFVGDTLTPPSLNQQVGAAVAGHFADPAKVVIRDLRKSLARNGRGYCGTVSLDGAAPFAPFHVIVEADGTNSLLVVPRGGQPDAGISKADAAQLLANFGCGP